MKKLIVLSMLSMCNKNPTYEIFTSVGNFECLVQWSSKEYGYCKNTKTKEDIEGIFLEKEVVILYKIKGN